MGRVQDQEMPCLSSFKGYRDTKFGCMRPRRRPGRRKRKDNAPVRGASCLGQLHKSGDNVSTTNNAVRPAMWVKTG